MNRCPWIATPGEYPADLEKSKPSGPRLFSNSPPSNRTCPSPLGGESGPAIKRQRGQSCLTPGGAVRWDVRVNFLSVLPALFVAATLWAAAADVPPEAFTADQVGFDMSTKEWVGRGHASLTYRDMTLTASEIRYNTNTGMAIARGNVILQRGPQRLLAEEMSYVVQKGTFDLMNLRAGFDPYYVSGGRVHGSRDDLIVERARATFHEPGLWTPTITADRMELHKTETLTMQGGRVGVGRLQPLPLPGFPIPVEHAFLRYLTLGAGYRASLGAFLEVGAHLPVAPGIEAGADAGFYTARGFLIGPSGEYSRGDGDRRMSGSFRSGFIHDSGDKLRDIIGSPIKEDRGFAHWSHRQTLHENLTLTANLNFWSDSDVLRDFRPEQFYPIQQPDNFVEANYVSDALVLGVFVRPHFNRYFRVQERLPEIQAALLPRLLFDPDLKLYQRGHASVSRLVEDAPLQGPTLRSDRLDAYYALTRTYAPREWLAVKPVVGAEVTHYTQANPGADRGNYTRVMGEVGADAEMRASGTYAYRNKVWKIDGLRHLVTPRLSYRYLPGGDRGRAYIPPIDRSSFSTYLQPLGLGDSRTIDEPKETNTLRLAVDNTLQTRDDVYGSRDLVRLNLAADWRFDHGDSERAISDIHTELVLSPARWLNFDLYQRLSTHTGRLEEINTGLTVVNSEWWSLRLGTHYLRNDIEEYIAESRVRLNEVFEGFARLHYDAIRSRFVQQTYGIRHTLDNAWVLQYGINIYEGRRRESSFGFVVELETVRF